MFGGRCALIQIEREGTSGWCRGRPLSKSVLGVVGKRVQAQLASFLPASQPPHDRLSEKRNSKQHKAPTNQLTRDRGGWSPLTFHYITTCFPPNFTPFNQHQRQLRTTTITSSFTTLPLRNFFLHISSTPQNQSSWLEANPEERPVAPRTPNRKFIFSLFHPYYATRLFVSPIPLWNFCILLGLHHPPLAIFTYWRVFGSRSSKAGLAFPVGRVHRLLRKGNYAQRVGAGKLLRFLKLRLVF